MFSQTSPTRAALEPQLKRKLDRACVVCCLINCLTDYAETARRVDVLLSRTGEAREEEVRVIKQIEELRAEIQSHVLPGEREMLDH